MIKRTLYFGNPVYLSTRLQQLLVQYPQEEKKADRSVPIEDIGFIVIDNPHVSMSSVLHTRLIENKVAIVHCNESHVPISIAQPLVGHSEQTERWRNQLEMSQPLKKNLWKQVVRQKIINEAILLGITGQDNRNMLAMCENVLSGDASNQEASAAAYYWNHLFPEEMEFYRGRSGPAPNHYLNYGYAILRAMVARAIVSSGLLPSIGIFHKNKYNPYCLADDLMEPYRVYVDDIVLELVYAGDIEEELTMEKKQLFLKLPAMDVRINGKRRPMMNAVTITTASLYHCIAREKRNLALPEYETI